LNGAGRVVVGQMMGAMKLMYNVSLIGTVILNPLLYNEYIIIYFFKVGLETSEMKRDLHVLEDFPVSDKIHMP
jgi:hypothetical protein